MINDKELNDAVSEWLKNDLIMKGKNLEELIDINRRLFNVERALKSEEYAHKKEIIRVQLRFIRIAFWACGLGFVVGALTHFKLIIS